VGEQRRAAGTPKPKVPLRTTAPTLREERRLLRAGHPLLAGMDEVGRGALAGPVSVGVVVVDLEIGSAPTGVRDSKLLVPAAREALVPRLRRWALAWAVGHAEPEEIDAYGIMGALRLAGRRALAQLPQVPTCVLLDGNHDWLTGRRRAFPDLDGLFPVEEVIPFRPAPPPVELPVEPTVHTMIKADMRCAAVAAASVLAKVERDGIMVERARLFPGYGWEENKGYSAPEHGAAIRRLGPCGQHRRSWSLPLAEEEPELAGLVDLTEAEFDELDLVRPVPDTEPAVG
jgi:ribonuclease HII